MIHTMCMLCCVRNVFRAYLVHIVCARPTVVAVCGRPTVVAVVCARPTVVAVVLIRRSMCVYDTYNCVCCAVCLRPTFYTVYV